METVFRKTHEIEPIHTDCLGRVKPSVLLYFAQEAAAGHCNLLRLDWETLNRRNLFWAVVRTHTEINRLPRLGEKITVETWPMPTTRTAYPRAIAMLDENGAELVRILSLWVLMDTQTRAMVLPQKSGVEVNGLMRGNELAVPASLLPTTGESITYRRVGYTELDRNGHMNTRYLDWVADLLPAEFHKNHSVGKFTVCYLSEAKEGEEIRLNSHLSDGPCLQVDGFRQSPNPEEKPQRIFSVQMVF